VCHLFSQVAKPVLAFSLLLLLAGCAAPRTAPLTGLVLGREMETLQSSVSLSVKTAKRSIGGRGYLIFKYPDRFHMAVLSPFGQTLADIYSDGERFSFVIPSRQTAFSGRTEEIPDREGLNAWFMMRWVMERTPVSGPTQTRANVNSSGVLERLYYDDRGLLVRKETEEGDRVEYRDYRNVNGVALPESLELGNRRGDTVRITFDEPEVNVPVDETVLQPNMEGLTVLPFSEFKGF
jgi:outer membrane lipoprotein-sorting protein